MTVTSKITISAKSQQAVALDHGNVGFNPAHTITHTLTNGVAANQVNQVFSDQRVLTGSSNEELDLSGGLTDALGNAIVFTKIKAIIISAAAANGGDIQVGGSAANGFNDWVGAVGDFVTVKPGGSFAIVAPDVNGYAVTAGTADLLKITNTDAGSATYDITLLGVE